MYKLGHWSSFIALALVLTACGGGGGGTETTTPVVETPVNNAPAVASANADQAAMVGTAFNYDATQGGATFSDADNDTLSFTVSYAPGAQGLTDSNGVISGTPSLDGTVTVSITADDGNGGSVGDDFDIVIAPAGVSQAAVQAKFGGRIDLNNPANYANQAVPNYITKLNDGGNPISDEGATLGRVLFYDVALSIDDTVSCASCHSQSHGFGDPDLVSNGVDGGVTGRHSMRLINTQFADEENFFWDERANSHEAQESQPLQDHNEHGFSGQNGRPDLNDLINKLEAIDYYQELFTYVYGDSAVTEERLQLALSQFVKSIQSFDSKFDEGRDQVNNNRANFPNFTDDENAGKLLYLDAPNDGGAGCQSCHRAPEFDIRPGSDHNGVVGVANSSDSDLTNTRSPSLRDLVKPDGSPNGPFMHDGSLATVLDVVNHYDAVQAPTTEPLRTEFLNTIDNRLLRPGGNLQNLNLTDTEKAQLVAFLNTLTGDSIYQDDKLSDPFTP